MNQPELGKYLSRLRKEQGLTQEELVERCNINVRTIQRIEAGEVTPRSYTVKNILEALGANMDNLFKEVPETTATKPSIKRLTLLIGMLSGLLYIIFYTLTSLFYVLKEMGLPVVSEQVFAIIIVASFIAMLGFYSVLALLFKIRKNSLAMVCIVCLMVLIAGSDLFTLLSYPVNFGTSTASVILGVSLMFLIGVVYVLLGVAIYRQREIYGDFEKWLGIIAVISGIGYAVIILFPVGIVGELVFEILLVSLFFKLYEQHKKA